MTDFEKDEFWKGLARLYDSSVEARQESKEQGKHIAALRKSIASLRKATADLFKVAALHHNELQEQRDMSGRHEKRLDRYEVIVEWLAEEQRKRDRGSA